MYDADDIIETTPTREPEAVRRYPKRNRKPRRSLLQSKEFGSTAKRDRTKSKIDAMDDIDDDEEFNSIDTIYSWYEWSDCKLAERYDKQRNFFPQPGPSNLNYYEDDDLTGYYRPVSKSKVTKSPSTTSKQKQVTIETPTSGRSLRSSKAATPSSGTRAKRVANGLDSHASSENSDWENEIHVQSFYEQSFVQNVPSDLDRTPACRNSPISNGSTCNKHNSDETVSALNRTISTPVISEFLANLKNSSSEVKPRRKRNADACTIKPIDNAPNRNDAKQLLDKHKLPMMVHPTPFYSDPNDVVVDNSKKEVGHTVLQLAGNAVNDCEAFNSQLNVLGMDKWQALITKGSLRNAHNTRNNKPIGNEHMVRRRLARDKSVRITPKEGPPSNETVRNWCDVRRKVYGKTRSTIPLATENGNGAHDENPVKLRRKEATTTRNQSNNCIKNNGHKQNAPSKDALIEGLLANKEITVRVTRLRKKADESNKVYVIDSSDDDRTDNVDRDDDNDIIWLDDVVPTKCPTIGKLVRYLE